MEAYRDNGLQQFLLNQASEWPSSLVYFVVGRSLGPADCIPVLKSCFCTEGVGQADR